MRIAVIGCGSIGRRHLRNLKYLGYADLLAFDPMKDARQEAGKEIKIPVYESLGELWGRKPHVALVTAPTNEHVEIALEAARRGCHLFIEKPLSHSMSGLDALSREVEERGLITMVGCNMRFHPGPMMVKHLITENTVGKVIASRIQTGSYLPRWRPWQDYRQSYSASAEWGGAILDSVHEIDLALWYFGPGHVVGAAQIPATAIGLETDGLAEILLRHENGVLSNIHLNFIQRDYRRTCQIIGAEGTIYWDFLDGRILIYGGDGELTREIPQPEGWEINRMYVDELAHFLQCVMQQTPTTNPISGGLAALRISLAARQIRT